MNINRSDVMVDLETLDTTPTSIILSIGACLVNWQGGEPAENFYRVVSVESQPDRSESSSTRAFWDKQPPEARTVFTAPNVPLERALLDFREYLRFLGPWRETFVWGNGSDFDNVILIDAYKSIDVSTPWPFYNSRCFRTIRKELGHLIKEPAREGVHHNALDDAIYQAKILSLFGRVLDKGQPLWPEI